MRVLVTYGSKLGGTSGIAETIAKRLESHGLDVVISPAAEKVHPKEFDAVVVGGALYASHWHKDARKYVQRFGPELKKRSVWLFSSGPLDESAVEEEIPPTPQVISAMERSDARGHVTFGGRLEEDAKGLLASAMAKNMAGDWRDAGQIVEWADAIAEDLAASAAA